MTARCPMWCLPARRLSRVTCPIRWVHPEGGAGRAAPGELARAGRDLVGDRVEHDREAEAEANALEGGLREQGSPERLQVRSAGQVVAGHVAQRAGAEQAGSVQGASATSTTRPSTSLATE